MSLRFTAPHSLSPIVSPRHPRIPGHLRLLVQHLAGLGEQFLAGLQADANHLEIVALDGVFEWLMGRLVSCQQVPRGDSVPQVDAESSGIRKLTAAVTQKAI